ncbi:MAG: leucine-rich repeat domain-containing protein, partial [Gammaproteobacteria bacterium]|nr:leucine-rich repeat domain-containing protein [Gammaproteobacteria bacterium]
MSFLRVCLPIAFAVCAGAAIAGDRRDIVFDCPCSAEWTPGAEGEQGTLTLVGGIRSYRAVQSGAVRLWGVDSGAEVGELVARVGLRGRWSVSFDPPGPDEVIELQLRERTGQGPQGEDVWHHHESLALWPRRQDASGPVRYVDLLTDSDGDGVGDVNEELAGTSRDDRESVPAGHSTVDVLALYSDEFADAERGTPHTRLLHVLTVTDALFGDSGTNIRLRTVGMSEVGIGEHGWAVKEQREELMQVHGADVSVQFHPCDTCSFGGIADVGFSLSGKWLEGYAWDTVGSGTLTAHELGHVMGLAHSARQGESWGAFRYSRGHYVSPHGETNSRHGTIMSYGGLASLGLRDVFSNPLADCGGLPCGVPSHELDGADAVASLDLLRFQIAAHRAPARDSDGDGFVDAADALPDDRNDWFDLDGDGIGDNADTDDDNDGVADVDDAFPADPDEWADVDFDGVGDNADDDVRDLSPFRDPALRAAVEEALGKARGAAISEEEMSSLTVLDASSRGIRDLTGIEQAVGLEELRLLGNGFTDFEPLSGLTNLRILDLHGNHGGFDLMPLSGLTRLNHLDLGYTSVRDLAALSGLTKLTYLALGYNEITDLGPLAGLTGLNWLGLDRNRVTELRPLAGLTKLTYLDLNDNEVTDLGPLAGLTGLNWLGLSRNRVTALEPLTGLTSLAELNVSDNPVADLSPLSGMTALYHLNVSRTRVGDISPLTGLSRLGSLGIAYTQVRLDDVLAAFTALWSLDVSGLYVKDLSALSEMVTLERLVLDDNAVADVAPLAKLRNLYTLGLGHNRVSDLTALAEMGQLERLDLGKNAIADIAPLAKLRNVRGLVLSQNGVSDLTALAEMERLETLHLDDNAIADIAPLRNLRNLRDLNLDRNQVSDVSPLSDMRSLEELRIVNNTVSDIGPLVDGAVFRD